MATQTFDDGDGYPLTCYGAGKQLAQIHKDASHLAAPGGITSIGDPVGDFGSTTLRVHDTDGDEKGTLNVDLHFIKDSGPSGPVVKGDDGHWYRMGVGSDGKPKATQLS